jgi:hypothetical protein
VVFNRVKWEDHPKAFVHHVGHVIPKKLLMFIGRLVGTALHGCGQFRGGPRRVGKGHRNAMGSVVLEGAMSSVVLDTV